MKKEQPQIISLSYRINNEMLTYPGDPRVRVRDYKTIESGGSGVKEITLGSHTGTHMDAPAHMLKDGFSLDDLPEIDFLGVARCFKVKNQDLVIGPEIIPLDLRPGEAIFLDTGYAVHWNTERFYQERPYLSDRLLDMLIQKRILALGIDTPSVDPKGSKDKHIHRKLFENDIIIYENLTNLNKLPADESFTYLAVPLPIAEADGSPLNILALVGDQNLVNSVLNFKTNVYE